MDGRSIPGMAQGVAQQIGQRAHEQIRIGGSREILWDFEPDIHAFAGLAADGFLGGSANFHGLQSHRGSAKGGFGKGEQLADERGDLLGLVARCIHVNALLFRGALLQDAERHLQPRERRTQLVGDVAEEAFLPDDKAIQPRGHLVDGLPERTEFIAPPGIHAHIETAVRDLPRRMRHPGHGARHAAHQRQPEEQRKHDCAETEREPWFGIEDQPAAADGVGICHEHHAHRLPRERVVQSGAGEQPILGRVRGAHDRPQRCARPASGRAEVRGTPGPEGGAGNPGADTDPLAHFCRQIRDSADERIRVVIVEGKVHADAPRHSGRGPGSTHRATWR